MEEVLIVLEKTELFKNLTIDEIKKSLKDLNAKKKSFKKNNLIYELGKPIDKIGLVISGNAHVIKEDFWGNRTILTQLKKGNIFGEVMSFQKNKNPNINVEVSKKSEILFLDFKKIFDSDEVLESYNKKLVLNMFSIVTKKSVLLTEKIEHITKKSIREKVFSYLSAYSFKCENDSFKIPFNRQELADYLSVERTALSRELSKMQEENLISFKNNEFKLIKKY
ncbi:Crp/Fnr family transcriptional regulator [Fusobacterium sp. IOR10]|uniref:Crp/Fnr family transcriptional regulator n=1 Tax=Fusobacterium sp. IOR10 TaxID=2665157 RepID=UPI0013D3658B|nr:Crp/Fnr family transcriptional regulator [Fusobacterium sp. IOR10]